MNKLAALACAIALSGCASGYEKFYEPIASNITIPRLPVTEEPVFVASSGDPERDMLGMMTDGFVAVGTSSFNGPIEGTAGAIKQAKAVGASRIVVSQEFARTVSGSIAISTPTSTTSYTSGTATVTGSRGFATGQYSGTTTTYGQKTDYIPYSVDRYDQTAVYFAPIERSGAGTVGSDVQTELAQRIGSAKGYVVRVVRKGSPAFGADILPGDVIKTVNGKEVWDATGGRQMLLDARGTKVEVGLLRNGVALSKTIDIPAGTW